MTAVATSALATTAVTLTLAVPGGLTLETMFVPPCYAYVGTELLLVTANPSTATLTVVRAQLGTADPGSDHAITAAVNRYSDPAYTVPTTATTTLSADITNAATTVNVVAGTNIAANDFIQVNSE